MQEPICTIVIRTLAAPARRESLLRAVASVNAGNDTPSRVLLLVNGSCFDGALLEELGDNPRVVVEHIPEASLALATEAGRRAVHTPFFGFLDDDDVLLPGAIDRRVRTLDRQPGAGWAVANGYRPGRSSEVMVFADAAGIERDPALRLVRENWLASCGGLFRADRVGAGFFRGLPPFWEWTWIGLRLASAGVPVAALEEPLFRVTDTPGSASKSEGYRLSEVQVLRCMRLLTRRADVRAVLRRKETFAWHGLAEHYLEHLQLGRAWGAHLRSLRPPLGLRFLSYTRHLLRGPQGAMR